eukprot:6244618-Pyramimonas_sp.AAC.1
MRGGGMGPQGESGFCTRGRNSDHRAAVADEVFVRGDLIRPRSRLEAGIDRSFPQVGTLMPL